MLSNRYLYCLSFKAGSRAVRSVTFEIYHARLDGSISAVNTIARKGAFAPGVEIRSYQGEQVAGGGDQHALADCVTFSLGFGDERVTVIRPIRAELADGSAWVSSIPPAVNPEPLEISDRVPPPPWDSDNHAGYIAVSSGGGSLFQPEPQKIMIYAPHRSVHLQ